MTRIEIAIGDQSLRLLADRGRLLATYPVSTGRNGIGCEQGSGKTPLGRHRVRVKIGAGCDPHTVFVARRPTGERYDERLAAAQPHRDWILCRILWLTGLESGVNRGGMVDTLRRFIYIHGTPDCEPMGVPRSHGCIRMRNEDLLDLFDRVRVGCPVDIER